MSNDCETVWVGGGDGSTHYLIADLGLWHCKICAGESITYLESIKNDLQHRVNCPIRIIRPSEIIGIKKICSDIPAGFEQTIGIEHFAPEISYP